MAQSISSAQKSFLSGGGLNNLGSDKGGDFEPDESLKALIQLAGLLIETAQTNLRQSAQVSSGALSDSFKVNDPQEAGKIIRLEIQAADYFDFQNKGVRGVRGGNSSGGYGFKSSFPSTEMVNSISKWIARGAASTVNVKKSASKLESKNKTISEFDHAFAVARSIKIHGIKGSGYFDKAIKIAQDYSREILGKALAIDIIQSLPKNLNNGNSNKR
jgi:hypothetical protein